MLIVNTRTYSTCVSSIIGLLVYIKILVFILSAFKPNPSSNLLRDITHCLLAYVKLQRALLNL